MNCAHCRKDFTPDEAQKGCESCGLFGGCHLLKCPHCGYEQPREPGMVQWLREKMKRKHSPTQPSEPQSLNSDGIIPLSALAVGEAGFVHSLMIEDHTLMRKLMSLGLLPAVRVKLIQKYPAYVLQIGYTQIAIDRQLAVAVKITPDTE